MKAKEYAITGLVIGLIAGVLAGFGALSQINKSQRQTMLPIAVAISAIGFAVIGYNKGRSIGRSIDIETDLGINNATEGMMQQGRQWVAITEWTDKNNTRFQLITGQDESKILVSKLNKTLVVNHEIKSGSKDNVDKHHKLARNHVFNQLKRQGGL